MKALWVCGAVCTIAVTLHAGQYTYANSGGVVTQGTSLSMTGIKVNTPAGTLSLSCPLNYLTPVYPYWEEWSCTGGSITLQSNNNSTSFSGTFTSATFAVQKQVSGLVTTYYYTLFGSIAGSLTINGGSQAVLGSINEALAGLSNTLGSGTIQSGTIDLSQRLESVYISDTGNNRIVKVLDIVGDNWLVLGKSGNGVNQFSKPSGIALDSSQRIYIADKGNCRIVRMDNISGKNWTSFGSCGSGIGQFSGPTAVAVDSTGAIYVADSGNNRIVHMMDISGTGFNTLGTSGTGTSQFKNPTGLALDSAAKIYVADMGNARIVRVDNIAGTNWTTMSASTGHFYTPVSVWVDSAAKVYVADSQYSYVVRLDNMTGSNPVYLGLNAGQYFKSPQGMYVDTNGAVYVADAGNNRIVRSFDMTGAEWTPLGVAGAGTGMFSGPVGIAAMLPSKPTALANVTPTSLTFPIELVHASSPSQSLLLSNIGTSPFMVNSIVSTAVDFPQTNSCPSTLAGGQTCTISVLFDPSVGGLRKGSISFSLTGATLNAAGLSGNAAVITVSPSSLTFDPDHSTGTVTVTNPGPGTAGVSAIQIVGSNQFTQSNNCSSSLAAKATCTITVSCPAPTGNFSATLEITDTAGTIQGVSLVGLF